MKQYGTAKKAGALSLLVALCVSELSAADPSPSAPEEALTISALDERVAALELLLAASPRQESAIDSALLELGGVAKTCELEPIVSHPELSRRVGRLIATLAERERARDHDAEALYCGLRAHGSREAIASGLQQAASALEGLKRARDQEKTPKEGRDAAPEALLERVSSELEGSELEGALEVEALRAHAFAFAPTGARFEALTAETRARFARPVELKPSLTLEVCEALKLKLPEQVASTAAAEAIREHEQTITCVFDPSRRAPQLAFAHLGAPEALKGENYEALAALAVPQGPTQWALFWLGTVTAVQRELTGALDPFVGAYQYGRQIKAVEMSAKQVELVAIGHELDWYMHGVGFDWSESMYISCDLLSAAPRCHELRARSTRSCEFAVEEDDEAARALCWDASARCEKRCSESEQVGSPATMGFFLKKSDAEEEPKLSAVDVTYRAWYAVPDL